MKRFALLAACLALFALPVAAQDEMPVDFPADHEEMPEIRTSQAEAQARPMVNIQLGELQPTPEMWFYEQQLEQRKDPKVAIRQRAEFRAMQRERRIAAREWYGYSLSRPIASPWPYNDVYSPMWRSSSYNPFQWRAGHSTVIIERSAAVPTVRYGMW